MTEFDVEAECGRLGIWPEPGSVMPNANRYKDGLRELVKRVREGSKAASPSFDEIAAAYKKVFGEDLYGVGHTKRERIQRFVWLLFGGVDA